MERFCWWLENEAELPLTLSSLTPASIRTFLAYTREANPKGRFGSDRESAKREARPATVNAYFRALRAFSNFCINEGLMQQSPLRNVKPPRVPKDQVEPFSEQHIQALLDVARRKSASRERDVAIILLLLDTGMRCAELCGLKLGDVEDRAEGKLMVTGKGNKRREVRLAPATRQAVWRYQEAARRDAYPDDPLFVSVGGNAPGSGMTHAGVHRIIQEAGKAAGIRGIRCSPHTLRHTFALNFLRGGGNLLQLQQLMGHEDLTVLKRYVALAGTDLAEAHRNASPVTRWKLK